MERIARARRLSPRDPHEWMTSMTTAMAHMWAHQFHESVAWAEKAIRHIKRPKVFWRLSSSMMAS